MVKANPWLEKKNATSLCRVSLSAALLLWLKGSSDVSEHSEEAVGQIHPKKRLPQDEIMVNFHVFLVSGTAFVLLKFHP